MKRRVTNDVSQKDINENIIIQYEYDLENSCGKT